MWYCLSELPLSLDSYCICKNHLGPGPFSLSLWRIVSAHRNCQVRHPLAFRCRLRFSVSPRNNREKWIFSSSFIMRQFHYASSHLFKMFFFFVGPSVGRYANYAWKMKSAMWGQRYPLPSFEWEWEWEKTGQRLRRRWSSMKLRGNFCSSVRSAHEVWEGWLKPKAWHYDRPDLRLKRANLKPERAERGFV